MTNKEIIKLLKIILKRLQRGQPIEPESKHEEMIVQIIEALQND